MRGSGGGKCSDMVAMSLRGGTKGVTDTLALQRSS